jgi:hypothetical protein
LADSLSTLSPVQEVLTSSFPEGWLSVDEDETRVWLVSIPLNRIELPLSGLGFAFLGEVDSMAFGVHGVHIGAQSLSRELFMTSIQLSFSFWTPKWTPSITMFEK